MFKEGHGNCNKLLAAYTYESYQGLERRAELTTFHFNYGYSIIALAVVGKAKALHQGMGFQVLPDGVSHSAGAFAMDNAYPKEIVYERLVQILVQPAHGFLYRQMA